MDNLGGAIRLPSPRLRTQREPWPTNGLPERRLYAADVLERGLSDTYLDDTEMPTPSAIIQAGYTAAVSPGMP